MKPDKISLINKLINKFHVRSFIFLLLIQSSIGKDNFILTKLANKLQNKSKIKTLGTCTNENTGMETKKLEISNDH